MIEALENEKQRVADSLALVKRAKNEAAMAKRLAEEKEKAKLDADNQRKQQLVNTIDELGFVYFNFNSSYINKDSNQYWMHWHY